MSSEYHRLRCDILVAGGGPAGVACALAAARCGATVILCQDRPVLGGNASSEMRMHVVGANGTGRFDRGEELTTEAREGGIIEEIRLENAVRNPQRSASVFDLILYDKCRTEPNLTLMLNTTVIDAKISEQRIGAVFAERQSTEDRFEITADLYVDCTGDGRLAFEAGAAFMEGRESRACFGESHAQAEKDGQRLGSTILLTARKHPQPMPFQRPTWARRFSKEDLRLRLYAFPGEEEPTHEYGYWWAEWGGTLDTIKDNETIRDELMSVALGIWDHVKNGPPEGGANVDAMEASCWALDWIGFLPAKRESRRFIGQHVLTEEDLIGSRVFPDAIAYGGWSIDLHPPAGVDAVDEEPCQQFPLPWLYDVPLRSCVARDIENLMFAGRNISATHVAFASTRVMATCAVIGQGVGTAAAYAVERNLTPRQLADNSDALQAIQQRLLLDDAFLIDRPIAHSRDVAQYASVTASSQLPGGEIEQLRSGFTRAVHGPRGVEPGRRLAGSHRWMSDPGRELPQSLLLEWEEACLPQAVQLIFDTGMHRHLTLTHHNGYASRMLWGTPQPETVRDYTIEVLSKSGWNTIVSIENNYLRLRRHLLNLSEPIRALRLQVTATNGLDHARVFDIRVLTSADPWSECL